MKLFVVPFLFFALHSCGQSSDRKVDSPKVLHRDSLQTAYFAAGCFWCVEAIFESIDGVEEVYSGYSGGKEKNPTYETVTRGNSLHAETVQIFYDSTKVTYDELLSAFFGSHDPSTLNRQGPDYGPQYRSIIFYQNESEKNAAKRQVESLLNDKIFDEITTQIIPLDIFYKAEIYHQDYEKRNPNNSYIQLVSKPRLDSFKAKYEGLLKKEQH